MLWRWAQHRRLGSGIGVGTQRRQLSRGGLRFERPAAQSGEAAAVGAEFERRSWEGAGPVAVSAAGRDGAARRVIAGPGRDGGAEARPGAAGGAAGAPGRPRHQGQERELPGGGGEAASDGGRGGNGGKGEARTTVPVTLRVLPPGSVSCRSCRAGSGRTRGFNCSPPFPLDVGTLLPLTGLSYP